MKSPVVMWIKLAVIAAATVALLTLMFLPTRTVTVTLDVPRGVTAETTVGFFSGVEIAAYIISGLIALAVIALAVWLSRKVIKHHSSQT